MTTALLDIGIVHLDAVSYLFMMPEKDLGKLEKDNKEKYLQPCLEFRHDFAPLVFSTD